MKRKRHHGDGHDNDERWLLTYSDLITLLLGLFVILYAMSKIDAGKYAEFVNAMEGAFGSPKGVMSGHGGVVQAPVAAVHTEREKIIGELRSAMHLDDKKKPISISYNERGITIHIMEEMLFASGSAVIISASLTELDSLATVLRGLGNDIRVEGHTDDVPINTAAFPSNWHLSVARAVNVGFYLIQHHGLNPERVSVVGYSEYRPLVPNDNPENRARNRRVDIVILTGNGQPKDDSARPNEETNKEVSQ